MKGEGAALHSLHPLTIVGVLRLLGKGLNGTKACAQERAFKVDHTRGFPDGPRRELTDPARGRGTGQLCTRCGEWACVEARLNCRQPARAPLHTATCITRLAATGPHTPGLSARPEEDTRPSARKHACMSCARTHAMGARPRHCMRVSQRLGSKLATPWACKPQQWLGNNDAQQARHGSVAEPATGQQRNTAGKAQHNAQPRREILKQWRPKEARKQKPASTAPVNFKDLNLRVGCADGNAQALQEPAPAPAAPLIPHLDLLRSLQGNTAEEKGPPSLASACWS